MMNHLEGVVIFAGCMALTWTSFFGVALASDSNGEGSHENGEMENGEVVFHRLGANETLGTVAMEYEVNLLDLKSWNGLESVDQVGPDDELEVRLEDSTNGSTEPLPVVHIVRRGDTFEGIANQYGVTVSQVRRWNRGVDPRRLQIGQQISLHIPGANGQSVSWGRANRGRLYNGIAMEDSPGLRVRNVARSYGTQRVINLLQAAGADVQARWPDAPELVVGSLSLRRGGPMRPHRSHQSGRDADLTYYHRGNVELPDFEDMSPETLDAVKNWHFFKTLIDTGEVEYIFVDYSLQGVLYDYAKSIGYTEEELTELIQYPRGRRAREGIIRHARGHKNHFHIRFTCGEADQNCR